MYGLYHISYTSAIKQSRVLFFTKLNTVLLLGDKAVVFIRKQWWYTRIFLGHSCTNPIPPSRASMDESICTHSFASLRSHVDVVIGNCDMTTRVRSVVTEHRRMTQQFVTLRSFEAPSSFPSIHTKEVLRLSQMPSLHVINVGSRCEHVRPSVLFVSFHAMICGVKYSGRPLRTEIPANICSLSFIDSSSEKLGVHRRLARGFFVKFLVPMRRVIPDAMEFPLSQNEFVTVYTFSSCVWFVCTFVYPQTLLERLQNERLSRLFVSNLYLNRLRAPDLSALFCRVICVLTRDFWFLQQPNRSNPVYHKQLDKITQSSRPSWLDAIYQTHLCRLNSTERYFYVDLFQHVSIFYKSSLNGKNYYWFIINIFLHFIALKWFAFHINYGH